MVDDERSGAPVPVVKVVDRRRFRPDGAPTDPKGPSDESGSQPPVEAGSVGPRADLAQKVDEQAARIDELTRAYAALTDDYKGFRARLEREKERVIESERSSVAQALLDAADELERAVAAVSGAGAQGGALLGTLVQGVRITLAGLHRRIGELGAQRMELVGHSFDPRTAEAVDAVPVADAGEDGIILEEVRPGYRIGDRILRPARVRVGRLQRS